MVVMMMMTMMMKKTAWHDTTIKTYPLISGIELRTYIREKKQHLQQMMLVKLDSYMQKNETQA